MAAMYVVTIDPSTDNADAIFEILQELTGSQQQTTDLLQTGGVVRETDDKDEAYDIADKLEYQGVEVEIELTRDTTKRRMDPAVRSGLSLRSTAEAVRAALDVRPPTGAGQRWTTAALVPLVTTLVVIGAIAGPAGAATSVVGFEEYNEGTELTTQYNDTGVIFEVQEGESAGAIVKTCDSQDADCTSARNGQNAIVTPADFEVTREPLVVSFREPQQDVSLFVREADWHRGSYVAKLEARGAEGNVVTNASINFESDSGWHSLNVSSPSARISRVILTLTSGTFAHNYFVVDDLTFGVNTPPTPAFNSLPDNPTVNNSVFFNASESFDPDGRIIEYRWDFSSDGTIDRVTQQPTVVASYRSPGTYTVTLEVVDDDGATARSTQAIEVSPPGLGADVVAGGTGGLFGLWFLRKVYPKLTDDDDGDTKLTDDDNGDNHPPTAAIELVPEKPAPDQPVFFDGSGSTDSDVGDQVASYRWTVDDREVVGPCFVHSFLQDGDHEVELQVFDTHRAANTAKKTVTVEVIEGELALDEVHPDSPGDDHENLDEEYLVFRNVGDAVLGVGGWTIYDTAEAEGRVMPGDHTFTFPDEFELGSDERVTVHTGVMPEDSSSSEDADGERHLYWNKPRAIWNNDKDVIVVEDGDGHPVLAVQYRRMESETYELEDLDVEVLDGWFGRVVVSSRDEAPLVSFVPTAGLGSKLVPGLVGVMWGATFLKGPKRFLYSWANIAGFFVSSSVTWAATTVTGILSPSIGVIIPLLLVIGSVSMAVIGGIGVAVQYVITSLLNARRRRGRIS